MSGDVLHQASSGETGSTQKFSKRWDYGFALAWELDFWGKFRRGIESNRATLQASVADYDDVLVTLLSDVATAYVQYRTAEQRIKYATQNVAIQTEVLKITKAQFAAGKITKIDLDQAESTLYETQAGISELEIALRTANNQLCILLGMPTEQLKHSAEDRAPIPVARGRGRRNPGDLLRRRPDAKCRAERQAAAQCAQIGAVAVADFYPHISIGGTIDYQSARFKYLFASKALNGSVGPSVQWDVLLYGRILNNVRLQDARFLELVEAYKQSVLNANQETENGLVTFLKAQERYQWQKKSVDAGKSALDTVQTMYPDKVDFTRVAQLLQTQVVLEDTLAQVQGEISIGLISVYKGLGGGWEIRNTGCAQRPAGAALPVNGVPNVSFAEDRAAPAASGEVLPISWRFSSGEAPQRSARLGTPDGQVRSNSTWSYPLSWGLLFICWVVLRLSARSLCRRSR